MSELYKQELLRRARSEEYKYNTIVEVIKDKGINIGWLEKNLTDNIAKNFFKNPADPVNSGFRVPKFEKWVKGELENSNNNSDNNQPSSPDTPPPKSQRFNYQCFAG